ncbi:MAG TPA: UDP-3-O-acyl-N-acetylglucosamine deacetylase [Rhizomicrobium sp.]|nr:UDP-3-O-acyl-N-acetylglucosamine deacetylase [Rhizomicrobium sp.]
MTRRTVGHRVDTEGVALHAGARVRMTLAPMPSGRGIVFCRTDLDCSEIPATYDKVGETKLGTVIGNSEGATVGVVEHLMAAVAGAGIDDLMVEINGPEPPILDGDALSYLKVFDQAGAREQEGIVKTIKVLKPIEVSEGDAHASLSPDAARLFDFSIDFKSQAIGHQEMHWSFTPDGFRRDIAPARTFGFLNELEGLRAMGLGRGASLENTLALDGNSVINAGLMRFPDEFVRHKILDAIGDLATAGAPIIGRFSGTRSGHTLNNRLLRTLFDDPSNYELVAA